MAVLFLTTGGELAWRLSEENEQRLPIPTGATHVLRFDDRVKANKARLEDVQQRTGAYTLTGPSGSPVLRLNGASVAGFPIASPTRSRHRDRRELESIRVKVFTTPALPLTTEEQAVLARLVFRLLRAADD